MDDRLADRKNNPGQSDQEDYNPIEHRPPGPTTSDFATLMHLLKASVGNGILFLPNGFKRAGYVMSAICGVCIGLLCTHTIILLVRASQELCVRHRIPMLNFAKTAELSLEGGPPRFRKYGKIFGIFANVLACLVHFQASVIYTLYVSTSFQQVIEFVFDFEMDPRLFILALCPIICVLGYSRNLKYLAPFSVIGFTFILTGVCVTLYYLLQEFPSPERLSQFTNVLPVPMYCNMFLYALHNATLLLPLENSMEKPKHLPRLIAINMIFNICVYTIFGFLGYNKYAENTCDTVVKNLPMEEPLAISVKVTISLSVLFSFGLAYYVPIQILWPMVESRVPKTGWGVNAFYLCGVAVTIVMAIAVPNMVPLLGLFASFSITTVMLMIPTVIDTATRWERSTRLVFAKNMCILLIYLILTIVGAVESTWSIVREYGGIKEKGC